MQLIIVPHQYWTREVQRLPQELVERARRQRHVVYFGTMLFDMSHLFGFSMGNAVAGFLRVFSQGFKVCIGLVLTAANAGLVESGRSRNRCRHGPRSGRSHGGHRRQQPEPVAAPRLADALQAAVGRVEWMVDRRELRQGPTGNVTPASALVYAL